MKPNLFLVGALKCATTSLYEVLGQHPEIFVAPRKEPTYFGSDLVAARFIRDRDRYLALFSGVGAEKWIGDASPWYLYSRRAAAEIAAFEPNARILVSLRNPVDVMYAAWWQQIFNGNEDIHEFAAALAAEAERREGRRLPPGPYLKEGLLYRAIVRFSEQVSRYLERFGRENVEIVIFDDLEREPRRVYRRILEFLEVDPGFELRLRVANPAKRVRSRRFDRWLRSPPAPLLAASRLLPLQARLAIRDALRRANWSVGERPPLDAALRAQLEREMAPEVRRLGELIGRDLSAWCET